MKKNIYSFFIFFIFFILLSSEQIIDYSAEQISYNNNENIIILQNNVKLKSESFSLSADSIIINRENNILYAYGNINLSRSNTNVSGDSVFYNYGIEEGVIFNGHSKIDKGYFFGEKINSINEREYFVFNGYFTTCDHILNPHYRLWGKNIHYYDNDRIIMKPAIMFLKNVPVLVLPFAVLPAATTRKSGFLMPDIGYDTYEGFYIKNISYFWATNDFSDMTFTVDYMSDKGIAYNYESRIIVKPYMKFNLFSTYIYEFVGNRRWSLKGDYSHNIYYGIKVKSRIDYLSDRNIITDYSDTLIVNLKSTAKSFLSLSKSFKKYSSYISFSREEDFSNNTVNLHLPEYSGNVSKIKLFSIPFILSNGISYSQSHSFSYNKFESDSLILDYKNYNINNIFDTYYKIFKFFNMRPSYSINYKRNEYDSLQYINNKVSLSFNTQIYGTSMFGILQYEKFRHTIIPNIGFNFLRYDYLDYFSFSNIDSTNYRKTINFSLSNIWEGKRKNKIDILLKNDNSISYNLENDSLSVLQTGFQIIPNFPFNSRVGLTYNIYSKDYTYNINTNLNLFLYNPFYNDKDLRINTNNNINFVNDSIINNQINTSISFHIGKMLTLNSNILYDIKQMQFISTSVNLTRDLHCWNAGFRISTYGNTFKYDFSISLKAFPEISIDKDILGPLFL